MFGSIEASTRCEIDDDVTERICLGNVYDFLEEDSINPYLGYRFL